MKHVLIIEDDRWLADIYKDILREDFKVTICFDGQSAMESIDEALPDIILLDIMLPGNNGFAFLQELRSYDDISDLPVLIVTGTHLKPQQLQALKQFEPVKMLSKSEITPVVLKKMVTNNIYATKQ